MNPDGFCYVLLSADYLTTDARMYSLRSDPRFGELQRRRVGLDAACPLCLRSGAGCGRVVDRPEVKTWPGFGNRLPECAFGIIQS